MAEKEKSDLKLLALKEIHVPETQVRKVYDKDKLAELEESIKQHGILQPLLVGADGDSYHLIAGNRRMLCAKKLKLENVPVLIVEGDSHVLSIIENIQRVDLHPIDQADGYRSLQDKHNYKQEELAQIVNKAQNTVSEILTLAELPETIKEEARQDRRWSRNRLLRVAKKKTPGTMQDEFEKIKEELDRKQEKKKQTKPQKQYHAALNSIETLGLRMDKCDWKAIKGKDKTTALERLENLSKKISQIIEGLGKK